MMSSIIGSLNVASGGERATAYMDDESGWPAQYAGVRDPYIY